MIVNYNQEAKYKLGTEVATWFKEKIHGSISMEIGKVIGYEGEMVDESTETSFSSMPKKLIHWRYIVTKDDIRIQEKPEFMDAKVALAKQFRFLGVEELP